MSQISRLRDAEISNGNLINADDIDTELNQLVSESNNQDTRLTSLESSAMTIAGVKSFSSAPKMDQINELSANAGVTVDSVLLKDGGLRLNPTAGYTPTSNGDLGYEGTTHALKTMVNGTARTLIHDGNMGLPKGAINGPAPLFASSSGITLKTGLRCRDKTNAADIELSSDITLSLATSGATGLDTGTEAANTWYYVYLIKKSSDGTVSAVFSTVNEANTGSITLPSGYDLKRQLPLAVRNDASSNIISFDVSTGWPQRPLILYNVEMTNADTPVTGPTQVLSSGTATTFTTVSLGNFVPPISKIALLKVYMFNYRAFFRPTGETHNGMEIGDAIATGAFYAPPFLLRTNTSQQIDYKAILGTANTYLDVAGFVITEVN